MTSCSSLCSRVNVCVEGCGECEGRKMTDVIGQGQGVESNVTLSLMVGSIFLILTCHHQTFIRPSVTLSHQPLSTLIDIHDSHCHSHVMQHDDHCMIASLHGSCISILLLFLLVARCCWPPCSHLYVDLDLDLV